MPIFNFAPALCYMLLFPAIMLSVTRYSKRPIDMDGIAVSWVIGTGIWLVLGLVLTYVK